MATDRYRCAQIVRCSSELGMPRTEITEITELLAQDSEARIRRACGRAVNVPYSAVKQLKRSLTTTKHAKRRERKKDALRGTCLTVLDPQITQMSKRERDIRLWRETPS